MVVQWVIAGLMIMQLCFTNTIHFFNRHNLAEQAIGLLIELRYKKLSSFFNNQDFVFWVQGNNIYSDDNSNILLNDSISLTSNRSYLGFTPALTTKYAGKLSLSKGLLTYHLTFPVGLGIIKCYKTPYE